MKYVITSYNKNTKIDGDGDFNEYFELGWELSLSRLCLISMIKKNLFDVNTDTVVTNDSRQFLYSKFCKNVLSYESFANFKLTENDSVYDLANEVWINAGYGKPSSATKLWNCDHLNTSDPYPYTLEQAPEICQFDLLDIDTTIKCNLDYICFVVRRRKWAKHRNLQETQIQKIINFARQKNLAVYIMGKNTECYDNPNNNVYYTQFSEFATLINSDRCKALITSASGASMIRFFTGSCKMITFDLYNEYNPYAPLWGGDNVIFSDLKLKNKWTILKQFDETILQTI